jgi:SAM-dependent methyltransferase
MHDSLEELTGRELRRLPDTPLRATADLGTAFGIDYRAPCDARATPFADASFDFISSTFTLEHIPEPDIAGILTECRRLLAPGAVLTASVDMQDHYSFSDPRISIYNFLRFSDRRWALINSALHYQNRLRACDYDRLFRQAGLPVTERTDTEPAPDQSAALDALPLADRFRTRYDRSELLAPAVTLVSVV